MTPTLERTLHSARGEGAVVRVLRQEYHRNGIGGVPFVVSLFDVDWPGQETQHMMGMSFLTTSSSTIIEGTRRDRPRVTKESDRRRDFIAHTGVLELFSLNEGVIGMQEGGAWRGSDLYGEVLADAYRQQNLKGSDFDDGIRVTHVDGIDPFEADVDEVPDGN